MPWAVAAAAITVGGSLLAGHNSASAAKDEGELAYKASEDNIASNERLAAQARADNEPFRQAGVSAVSALGNSFGLPGYGAPSMTAPSYASTPVPNAGGVSMTGKTAGGMSPNYGTPSGGDPLTAPNTYGSDTFVDPRTGLAPGQGGQQPVAAPAAPAAGTPVPDVDAFLAANPDIAQYWNATPEAQKVSLQDFALDAAKQQADVRGPMPTKPAPYVAPAGYTDPTAPNGYGSPERPDAYTAPVRMTGPALDVSEAAYHTSPGFGFQMEQGQLGLDHVASAGGGIMSGARQKAALRFSQGLADQDYTDWRNYTTSQFNTDRARGDNIYADDRAFGYGQNRDSQSDFQTDRGYTTGRYDTRNAQLMTLAGFGTNANANNTNAATSFAQNSNAARSTGAAAQGAAGVNSANAYTGVASNLMTTGAYLGGQYLSGNMGGSAPSFTPSGSMGSSFNFTPWG